MENKKTFKERQKEEKYLKLVQKMINSGLNKEEQLKMLRLDHQKGKISDELYLKASDLVEKSEKVTVKTFKADLAVPITGHKINKIEGLDEEIMKKIENSGKER